jgi:site-specific DNA recombinase
MYGNRRHNTTYYMWHPASNNRGRPDKYAGHEKAAHIREDEVLDAVSNVYIDRVFGPHRRELFAAGLASTDDRETRQREADRERLQRTLARRQDNVMRQAQDCAPGDPFGQGLRQTYNDLKPNAGPLSRPSPNSAPPTKPDRPDPPLRTSTCSMRCRS